MKMSKFRMDDGSIIDTERASDSWGEDSYWDGKNRISSATGSQWAHQKLYRSRKGRYYVEHWSNWEGTRNHVEWISREEAARWLLSQNHELPKDLAELETEIIE